MNLLEVLTQSYRMSGVLRAAGRGISGSEQAEGMHVYNAMLDGVKIERWFFYQIIRSPFLTVVGQKDYSIGDAGLGANWAVERPEKVMSAGVLVPGATDGNEAEIPIYVVQSYQEYQRIICKLTPSSLAQVLYYQAALPLGVGTLWPVPNREFTVILYTPQTVQEFTDVEADYIVPKGYREWMEYEGAVKIYQRNHRIPGLPPLPKEIYDMANLYKGRVMAQQWTPALMRSDGAVLKHGGVGPDWFNGRTMIPG